MLNRRRCVGAVHLGHCMGYVYNILLPFNGEPLNTLKLKLSIEDSFLVYANP
jgi:hypothetical protein